MGKLQRGQIIMFENITHAQSDLMTGMGLFWGEGRSVELQKGRIKQLGGLLCTTKNPCAYLQGTGLASS